MVFFAIFLLLLDICDISTTKSFLYRCDISLCKKVLYQTLCVINWQYNVPNTSFGRKDNKLLYFVAENMIEYSQILSSKSVELIAFNLSQFVNEYSEFIEANVNLPIIGLNNELRKNEAKKTLDIGNRYWLSIMENCNSLHGIYSDGVVFYIFRHQVDSIFSGRDLTLVKDDALVYAIAELMKHQLSSLEECDVNLVAYKIAEKLGTLLSTFSGMTSTAVTRWC